MERKEGNALKRVKQFKRYKREKWCMADSQPNLSTTELELLSH